MPSSPLPPLALWHGHLPGSSSSGRVKIHLETGQQPVSDIILRPGTVFQSDNGWLRNRRNTHLNTYTHTPAMEIRLRWWIKCEALGKCESQVWECIYQCLKMCVRGVLIGWGLWVQLVKRVYVKCTMAGEKERSVKTESVRMTQMGCWEEDEAGEKNKRQLVILLGLLEQANIKLIYCSLTTANETVGAKVTDNKSDNRLKVFFKSIKLKCQLFSCFSFLNGWIYFYWVSIKYRCDCGA